MPDMQAPPFLMMPAAANRLAAEPVAVPVPVFDPLARSAGFDPLARLAGFDLPA